jgi:hypothetical protein
MAKRIKRIKKGAESLKKEIEEHFLKIEEDFKENQIERARYHTKEIDKGLLKALEVKLKVLKIKDDSSLKIYRARLDNLRNKLGVK